MIREAGPDDLDTIVGLVRDLAQYEQLEEEMVSTAEDFRLALFGPSPVARVSLAVADTGEVAGMALWFPTFSTFLGRPGIWLEDLFVRPAHRGRGHGRALLEHLRSRTGGRVEWAVLDWNQPAIDFYRGLGARPLDGWTTYRWW
jgi:GNAT superfamily N-acetyltransferase